MSPFIRRVVAIPVAVLLAAAAALAVQPVPAQADAASELNSADMTLLIGLRQAALWEIPAAKTAAAKGVSETVRQAGQKLAAEQSQLDQQTGGVIAELGVKVSATPTTEQQHLLGQVQSATGEQLDRLFVNSLRNAYGVLYTVIGEVRSATRIAAIRQLADQANVAYLGYMQLLEETGLVQYQSLAPAAIPPAQDLSTVGMAKADAGLSSPISLTVLWLLALAAAALAVTVGLRIVRSRRTDTGPRVTVRRG